MIARKIKPIIDLGFEFYNQNNRIVIDLVDINKTDFSVLSDILNELENSNNKIDNYLSKLLQSSIKKYDKQNNTQYFDKLFHFSNLINVGNSCYQDAILMALFVNKNSIVNEKILSQKDNILNPELITLIDNIRNNKNCNILELKKKYIANKFEDFSDNLAHDANEFLNFFFEQFKFNIAIQYSKTVFVNENSFLALKTEKHESFPIFHIPYYDGEYELINCLSTTEYNKLDTPYKMNGKLFNTTVVKKKIVSDYVIFYSDRKNLETRVKLIPNEKINQLNLFAIVIFINGHYFSIIKNNNKYFCCDDLKTEPIVLGNYEEIMDKHNDLITICGTMYFYSTNSNSC